jgi:ribose transport system permease protein
VIRHGGAIGFFIAFFILVAILKPGAFLTWDNFALVGGQNAHVAFVAVGLTFALIAGQFDLSVGALMGLAAMLIAGFTSKEGIPLFPAAALVVAIGAVAGLLNGLLVTRLNVNAFIATLGTGSAFTGIVYLYNGPNAIFEGISKTLTDAGARDVASVPLVVIAAIGLLIIAWMVSRQTVAGRFFEAVGANPDAARLAGVPVKRYVVLAFVLTGMIVSVGGIVFTARFGSADPASGPSVLLPAFSACFLGTALLPSDGRFTIVGTLIAAFLIAWSENALEVLGLNVGIKLVFDGAVLVAAVAINQLIPTKRVGRASA